MCAISPKKTLCSALLCPRLCVLMLIDFWVILLVTSHFNGSFIQPIRKNYLDISCIPLAVSPRVADARESSLWMVELAIVSIEEKRGEGLLKAQEERK